MGQYISTPPAKIPLSARHYPANHQPPDATAGPVAFRRGETHTPNAFSREVYQASISHQSLPDDGGKTARTDGLVLRRGFVSIAEGRVSIETDAGSRDVVRLRESLTPAMTRAAIDPMQMDLFAGPAGGNTPLPALNGEILTAGGEPARWSWRPQDFAAKTERACELFPSFSLAGARRLPHSISFGGGNYAALAGQYRSMAEQYSAKYNLTSGLLLAVMHTESNFDPFAVSPRQAIGLMQVVPDSAGSEVHRYLTGAAGSPSVEALMAPEFNIKYGAAYLHILGRRYFGDISDSASRQLCIIAAYNGGPNMVLRAFDQDQEAAVAYINTLSPEEVYTALVTRLPRPETRRYVETVSDRMQAYSFAR